MNLLSLASNRRKNNLIALMINCINEQMHYFKPTRMESCNELALSSFCRTNQHRTTKHLPTRKLTTSQTNKKVCRIFRDKEPASIHMATTQCQLQHVNDRCKTFQHYQFFKFLFPEICKPANFAHIQFRILPVRIDCGSKLQFNISFHLSLQQLQHQCQKISINAAFHDKDLPIL